MMRSGGNDRASIFFLLTLPPLGSAFFYYSLLSAARSSTGIKQKGIHYREDGFRTNLEYHFVLKKWCWPFGGVEGRASAGIAQRGRQ